PRIHSRRTYEPANSDGIISNRDLKREEKNTDRRQDGIPGDGDQRRQAAVQGAARHRGHSRPHVQDGKSASRRAKVEQILAKGIIPYSLSISPSPLSTSPLKLKRTPTK